MDSYYKSTRRAYHRAQIIWYLLGILEALLAFRFLFKLFHANVEAQFTHFIYTWSQPLASPFLNVFSTSKVENSSFEWTTLLSMGVYWLVAYGLVRLFMLSRTVASHEEETAGQPVAPVMSPSMPPQQQYAMPQQMPQNQPQPTPIATATMTPPPVQQPAQQTHPAAPIQ